MDTASHTLKLTAAQIEHIQDALSSRHSDVTVEIRNCDPECTDDLDNWKRELAELEALIDLIADKTEG